MLIWPNNHVLIFSIHLSYMAAIWKMSQNVNLNMRSRSPPKEAFIQIWTDWDEQLKRCAHRNIENMKGTSWPWILGQGHQSSKVSWNPPKEALVKIWTGSLNGQLRYAAWRNKMSLVGLGRLCKSIRKAVPSGLNINNLVNSYNQISPSGLCWFNIYFFKSGCYRFLSKADLIGTTFTNWA